MFMKKITLEMSLKPFKETTDEYIREVCRGLYQQWRQLLKEAEEITVMLWTADGSEILEYAGELDDEIEWCRYIGGATHDFTHEGESPDLSLHKRKHLYTDNPPVVTYRTLKRIVAALRSEGASAFPNAKIRIGETFDIGPEFADSKFKYKWHNEICTGGSGIFAKAFIDSTALLNGDKRRYAAYPDGIPDGTPFGLFLGRQTRAMFDDVGFDYIWLSNGLGFSSDPWDATGKIYDGKEFFPERLEKVRKDVFQFWRYFREGCPGYSIECRGTNNSAGIDYATDGVPLYDIYHGGFGVSAPPNSPWAALNGNYGLELMGHMTRICDLPDDSFMFRYYIHDPWWANSPWYDRYEGEPHDIYLPMAVSRIDRDGNIRNAEQLNLLTVDNSFGELPDSCANEPLPHILKSVKDESDYPAPFVWVYPMKEYTHSYSKEELSEMYFADSFICGEINRGFPLNCVVSTGNFNGHDTKLYSGKILIAPAAAADACREKLLECAKNGARVIIYGSRSVLDGVLCGNALAEYADTVDISGGSLIDVVKKYGYTFEWGKSRYALPNGVCEHAMTVNRSDNAYMFSVYNRNTTVDCSLRLPEGAPLLLGYEAEISDGKAKYHFPRSAHKECRIFIDKQNEGVVSARETAPVSVFMRRRIVVLGLRNADLYFFPETYCAKYVKAGPTGAGGDNDPVYFENAEYLDTPNGSCLKLSNISGGVALYMPEEKYCR